MKRLVLQLVTYNGSKYLPALLESLKVQTDQDWYLWVLDNSTTAEEREKTRVHIEALKQQRPLTFLQNAENNGFAGGHQQLFAMHDSDYVLLINQDTILESKYVHRLRRSLEKYPSAGAVAGRILRYSLDAQGVAHRSTTIDSLGLERLRSQRVRDYKAGTPDLNVHPRAMKMFGVSGCLPMYRRSAVEMSRPDGKLFDPCYHSYKEDIDIAYALKRCGWESVTVPWAIAYHDRTVRDGKRERMNAYTILHSYRNHLWNVLIHIGLSEVVKTGGSVVVFELAKASYLAIKHPRLLLQAWRETASYWKTLINRRRWYASVKHVKAV